MTSEQPARQYLSVRQAAFIGVGAMVGAGIFALLGAAGAKIFAALILVVMTHRLPAPTRHLRHDDLRRDGPMFYSLT